MSPQQLRQMAQQGENLDVEFKSERQRALSDDEIVRLVVCMANRASPNSGWILIGVEDDGALTGARPRHGDTTDPLRLQAMIANRTSPSLSVRVRVLFLEPEQVQILAIETPPVRTPVGTTDGVYLRRAVGGRGTPECLPMRFHEIQSLQAARGLLDYSAVPVEGATWDDLSPLEFERLRQFIRESRGQGDASLLELPDEELAKALGAVDANHAIKSIRVLGLLLFGTEDALRRFLPTHEVAFQVLRGQQVEVNLFYRYPLLRTMEELLQQFRARYREEDLIVGLLRVGAPEYSERAFREAVANALIHRDYTRLGAVHIQWYEDRIEVSNPGGFPEGVSVDNILVTPPRPRNPLLADAFKRAGLVERTGRGVDIVFAEQLRNGRPAPSYARTTPTDVVLTLYGGEANLALVRMSVEESQSGRPLGLNELLILNALWQERRLTTARTAQILQRSVAEARAVLERLIESGLVEGRGEGKGRVYQFSAATYRRLGTPAAYVRQRGFEPLQQEQMVLQYVERHGSVSRKEVAELCHLSAMQAYRLLKRLEQAGKIRRLEGSTKGARYGKASD